MVQRGRQAGGAMMRATGLATGVGCAHDFPIDRGIRDGAWAGHGRHVCTLRAGASYRTFAFRPPARLAAPIERPWSRATLPPGTARPTSILGLALRVGRTRTRRCSRRRVI